VSASLSHSDNADIFRATWVLAAPSEDVLAHSADPASMLTIAERHRAGRFRFDRDRCDFIAAHILARIAGSRVIGVEPQCLTLVQSCVECGEPHGVPFLAEAPGLGVSLSHTRGYVAAAVGPGQVGVDVEGTASTLVLDHCLASAVMAPAELALLAAAYDERHAFVRLWVRKEALVKSGQGSLDMLYALDVSAPPLVDLTSRQAHLGSSHGHFLLEWQDRERRVLGAATTTYRPDLALLPDDQSSPELHDFASP
jgi:4'-phosphopantetheinyl transferase